MKTPITKKIDDIGRVVIPQEIRQSMNIAGGDSVEFHMSANGGSAVLRKYSPIRCFSVLAQKYCREFKKLYNMSTAICDMNSVIACRIVGDDRSIDLPGSPPPPQTKKVIQQGRRYIYNIACARDTLWLCDYPILVLVPIYVRLDAVGSMALLARPPYNPSYNEVELMSAAASLFGAQLRWEAYE